MKTSVCALELQCAHALTGVRATAKKSCGLWGSKRCFVRTHTHLNMNRGTTRTANAALGRCFRLEGYRPQAAASRGQSPGRKPDS